MENEIIGMIGSLGFPIAICVFLLIERNKTLKELISVIHDLKVIIKTRVK